MKLTKRPPKKEGFYWLLIPKADGTPKKGFPKVVKVEQDDRFEVCGRRVKKGDILAQGYWASSVGNKAGQDTFKWSQRLEEPEL